MPDRRGFVAVVLTAVICLCLGCSEPDVRTWERAEPASPDLPIENVVEFVALYVDDDCHLSGVPVLAVSAGLLRLSDYVEDKAWFETDTTERSVLAGFVTTDWLREDGAVLWIPSSMIDAARVIDEWQTGSGSEEVARAADDLVEEVFVVESSGDIERWKREPRGCT